MTKEKRMSHLPLKHGLFLPPFHKVTESPTISLHRDMEIIRWADELGFDEAWVGEHHSGGFEIISSPEILLAAVAERTRRIRLGTGVVSLPYHNPLMVANRIVQLDHMTQGRVIFGVGPGLLVTDARMLGIDPQHTRDRMAEALEVIVRLFRGETVSHTSDWFVLKDARLHFAPFQLPHPEIALASSISPSGAKAAGKFGFSMLCVAAADRAGFDALKTNWEIATQVAEANGKKMDPRGLRLVAPIHIAETREQAAKNVQFGLRDYMDYSNSVAPGRFPVDGDPVAYMNGIGGAAIGTPDDAIALIERLIGRQGDFGVFLQMAHNWADWDQTRRSYELYARYVIPHFTKVNANRNASLSEMARNASNNEAERRRAVDAQITKYATESKKG
ncbi:LLM class flavin-dependent oxidoreductase [Mesorhizobium sp. M2D.F.Ca.ET.185.01.1.1]|uniref:LLM class flavin-dependent oxidoreductase n=2 Tax=Mesorhizobium TaxID=68287 RepID=UPI000FCCC569|nr:MULTISPECIES: LLM class flavin-dependent oxidoreductase [unclassified Mesorhizobium]TGP77342.1 LLM class flavin-dependent oxidoreductase [bacterium M00.F.Ca.ET.227.01.1.1]TGP93136.1 LLM class flavin-dependent oxidoreductase [bacterium M00.F.Ca.ET.222.01.1.1]TGP96682.1 LLM class flavin-dependent oxidoreductase [bacterium M00.F.Ca.ET.221.01.1.1]TGU18451.1 LLM class flavin-dependent oxidoreductase [bacterium M00.F.Ca.ET.156.01.1.1]TGU49894.1 LLM class flavin-dependent oxidoreductase [bacterium